ncbi:hypothetical protein MVES1_003535 [Malassezia vespertilionis]|uniref:Uncharacterized protein n=1 Tax=Malassezia vespertilionis TaxID=2020962 RepID=A0A2N1J8C7_9BASI|nr:uncharacterized protein MVES1_003535 [Malassezia vespertilionis]PKI82799.1 hypothetical protein MVES_003115 [Malassezia vespertilionis]WFD08164.1 hypothetical protein MVES1_003535 [Malassezia vespertilionis]
MGIASFYHRCFTQLPWVTLMVTNGTLFVAADALAQSFESRKEDTSTPTDLGQRWDLHRSARFLAFGTGMAPLLAEWNKFIEHGFPIKNKRGAVVASGLARRVLMDQLAFAPFGLLLFVGSMGLMEGRRTLPALEEKFRDVYWPALKANWAIWPFLQLVNFSVVPLGYVSSLVFVFAANNRLRVPFSASCGVAWTLYLSLLNQRDVPEGA